MASLDLQRRGEWRPLPDPKRQRPSAETSRAAVALELEAVEDLPKRTGKNILPGIPLQHSGVSDLLAFAFLDDAGAPSTVSVPEARASNSSDERPPSNSSGHGDSPLTKSASDSSVNSATAVDVSEGKSLGMVSPQPSNISLSSLDRTEPSVDASPVKPAVLSPIFGSPSGLGSPLIAPSSSSFS